MVGQIKRILGSQRAQRAVEAPPESAAVRGDLKPPEAFKWSPYGQADQVLAGRPGVGHETPGVEAGWMRSLGERDGAVRLDDAKTVAPDAPPIEIAKQAGNVRIGVANQGLMRAVAPLEQFVQKAPGLIRQALAKAALLNKKLQQLEANLPTIRLKLPPKERARDAIKDQLDGLPFYRQGLVSHYGLVAFVLAAVGVFDAAVLRSALTQSSMDGISIWLTTIGVALVLAAINEPLGRLAAAIGLAVPGSMKLKLAAFAMAGGLLALLTSIVMLGVFRHLAMTQQNEGLEQIAAGNSNADFNFVVDPAFLAPLQVAACAAAMLVVALYVLGKDGARLRKELRKADQAIQGVDGEIKRAEQKIEQVRDQVQAATLEVFEIEAKAAGAQVEVVNRTKEFEALVGTEIALSKEMAAIYRTERNYFERMLANGGVWRMALPTVFRRFRKPYTPGPTDAGADDALIEERHRRKNPRKRWFWRRPSEPSTNGQPDQPINPDQLTVV